MGLLEMKLDCLNYRDIRGIEELSFGGLGTERQ